MRRLNSGRNWLMHRVPGGLLGKTSRLARPVQAALLTLLASAAVLLELL